LTSTPNFGRRKPAAIQAFLPPPAISLPAPAPAKAPARRSAVDPEFAAWARARAKTRWKTWGTCALLLLGGPMSLLLPEGVGQWAGMGLMGLGAAGFLARFRKPTEPTSPTTET
jgi:hypothetical protein